MPTGNPEAAKLLDRAEAAANGGDAGLARALLRKVVTDYPESKEAQVAQKSLATESEVARATLVRVVDVDIGFWTMVMLFVKAAFALIPAAIIVTILVLGLASIVQIAGM